MFDGKNIVPSLIGDIRYQRYNRNIKVHYHEVSPI